MSEPEFLFGKALADRVRLVCREDAVDCAVAFLGQGLRDDLFPAWERQKVRIVCDLAMGCTSRAALKEFGAPENDDLIYYDGLHAKVYLSRAGAVIGSSNLSRNGLGLTTRAPGNLEAGVFHPAGSQAWKSAKLWFEEVFDPERKVDEMQLGRVPSFVRDPGQRIDSLGPNSPSVLKRLRDYPGQFDGVVFLSTGEEMTPQQERAALDACERDEQGGLVTTAKRQTIWYNKSDLVPNANAAILYWHDLKEPEVIAYTDVVRVRMGRSAALLGRKKWASFWRERGMQPPDRQHAFDLDRQTASSLPNEEWVFNAPELAAKLSEAALD